MSVPKLPQIDTGDLKADQRAFLDWCAAAGKLPIEQALLSALIEASFRNLLTMNKDKPAAWAKLKELHDADVEQLKTMLG